MCAGRRDKTGREVVSVGGRGGSICRLVEAGRESGRGYTWRYAAVELCVKD